MTEAIIAVTPSETIKYALLYESLETTTNALFRTKLIDDAKRPNPQYRGLVHETMSIVRQEGILGIYRRLFPVVSWPAKWSRPTLIYPVDDAPGSQLRCPIHDIHHTKTACPRYCTARTAATRWHHVRHKGCHWPGDGICHTPSRVRSYVLLPVFYLHITTSSKHVCSR